MFKMSICKMCCIHFTENLLAPMEQNVLIFEKKNFDKPPGNVLFFSVILKKKVPIRQQGE